MKYALLVYNTPECYDGMRDEQRQSITDEYTILRRDPSVINTTRLKDVSLATTVRVSDGKALLTDGPFADTKEVFGGIFLIEVETIDAALQFAARIPASRLGGSVEVRPILD